MVQGNEQRTEEQRLSKCIWMDAGVVAYLLCDRDFQCDECPFDIVMRQRSHTEHLQKGKQQRVESGAGAGETARRPIDAEELLGAYFAPLLLQQFPDDRRYANGQTWVCEKPENGSMIGLDAVGAKLAGQVSGVVLPQVDSHIVAGEPFAWLLVQEGAIPLVSPVSGLVVQINGRLIEHPHLVLDDPYGDGWIAVIHAPAHTAVLADADDHQRVVQNRLRGLRHQFERQVQHCATVGATMHDGGARVRSLEDMLGSKVFLRLISSMFAP